MEIVAGEKELASLFVHEEREREREWKPSERVLYFGTSMFEFLDLEDAKTVEDRWLGRSG